MAGSAFSLFGTRKEAAETKATSRKNLPLARLRELGCRACPLANADVKTPRMVATGAEQPLLYVLGESPTAADDETPEEELPEFGGNRVRQFLGKTGERLRSRIPEDLAERTRFNNVLNDRTPGGRNPAPVESECCRGRVASDIAAAKPKAVLALGGFAAGWFGATGGINIWRGRRFPAEVGGHKLWVYPTLRLADVVLTETSSAERKARWQRKEPEPLAYPTGDPEAAHAGVSSSARNTSQLDEERAKLFDPDLERCFSELSTLPEPIVLRESDFLKDYRTLVGGGNEALANLREALKRLDPKRVAIDLETHGLRPYAKTARLLTFSVSDGVRTVGVGVEHPEAKWENLTALWQLLVDFLATAGKIIAHRGIFELEWILDRTLRYLGTESGCLLWPWHDTQAQAYVLDGDKGALSLNARMLINFGVALKELSNVDRANLIKFPLLTVLRYNALDSEGTALLYVSQARELKARGQLATYRFHIERIPTIVAAQATGVHVHAKRALEFQADFAKQIAKLEGAFASSPEVVEFRKLYGPLNTGSPKQLTILFRDLLKREEGKRGAKYTTDETALTAMADNGVALATKLIELRGLSKLKGTYIDPLILGVDGAIVYPDGRLHTTYSDTGTDTGRLASEDPNLQNFPSREFKQIRNMIYAGRGRTFLAADYGQIEYRVIAILSGDSVICKALAERYDVHMEWAKILGTEIPELLRRHGGDWKQLRAQVKNQFVFPSFYLAGEGSVARYLHVSRDQIKPIFRRFWKTFDGVKQWQNRMVEGYRANGYVESPTGRRRYGPLSMSAIVNTPVQSAASDIVIDAMNRLARKSWADNNDSLLPVLNIHDDLITNSEDTKLEASIQEVVPIMLRCPFPWVTVPLSAEIRIGKSWGKLTPVGDFYSDEL